MKTLRKLRMDEFVDITCGNIDIILEKGEKATKDEIKRHVGHLIVEYKSIVNPSGMKAVVSQQKQKVVRSARIYILRVCVSLLLLEDLAHVKDILNEMGWRISNEDKDALSSRVQSELRRLEFEEKRSLATEEETEPPTEEEMRAMFDKEQAALMTYYKMPFAMESVTASVYANLVAQAEREIAIRKNMLKIN